MIKRLRLTFLWVSMALITLVLVIILGLICRFTWEDMRENVMHTLQLAAEDMGPGGPPGSSENRPQTMSRPCFVLSLNPRGQLEVTGSSYYDLSDKQQLRQILEAAQQNDKRADVLMEYALAFYRADSGPVTRYAFMDVSSEISTMQALLLSCAAIGIAAFVLFFVLMLALSKWMVRPVEDAWSRQRQFIADASHELKTPLTVILTNAELLQSQEYDAASKDRFVRSIHTMSVQMRGLVEGLLEMARLDNGVARKQMCAVDLSRLVEEATLPFEAMYFEAERTLESDIAPGLSVYGSASHLRQVVEILLDNGRKYSRPGTTVRLQLSRQSYGRVQLRLTSQGESLSSQQCKDIFKRFYRVDEARAMNHSYGLGLSIAQSIITEHKGRIWCESADGTNVFYVNLPTHH